MARNDSVIPAVKEERGRKYEMVALTAVVAGAAAWFGVAQLAPSPSAESPVSYTAPEYGYQVTFPGEPEEVAETQLQAGVELETTTVSWTGSDRAHMVSATEFPEFTFESGATDAMLLASLESGADAVGGSVEDHRFVDLDGEPAIAGLVSGEDIELRAIFVIRGDVMLAIQSINGTGAQHDAFVRSFAFDD